MFCHYHGVLTRRLICHGDQVPTQWDASLITSDSVFKSNANYVKEFLSSAAYIPTYNAASGSATVMAL
jgi:hypothetical protein